LNHPHIFTANLVYVLPVLQGRNAFVRRTLGSWQASTIVSASSGPSISTLLNGGVQGLGDPAGAGIGSATSQEPPNRVAGQTCRTAGMDATQFINPNMFTVNRYQLGHVGNAGIGTCLGPGNTNVDFGVDKNFKISERIKAQFRFEFFNLFNHPSYSAQGVIHHQTIGFNNIVYGDASGKAVPLTSATQILSATPAPGSNFGRTQSIRENGYRQLQYALKFTF
jgi:hypothetical protein